MSEPAADTAVEERIGYVFADRRLLAEALTHRSYSGEHGNAAHYERLEFLGDAVLQLAVTRYLYQTFPDLPEGQLAKVRASVVSERTLVDVAARLAVGPALRLGRGEAITGGRAKPSLLSDVVEALIGAIFVEAGFERAAEVVVEHLAEAIATRSVAPGHRDFKTRLQEILARTDLRPHYVVVQSGPEHAKRFAAVVSAGGRVLGEGTGSSKKRAEQVAAEAAVATLRHA
ncbi:MAG: ribonuclease III [Acidimicrobiia bacterium]|nr:ribonuclease III [Acidimicrobiia bacterium]